MIDPHLWQPLWKLNNFQLNNNVNTPILFDRPSPVEASSPVIESCDTDFLSPSVPFLSRLLSPRASPRGRDLRPSSWLGLGSPSCRKSNRPGSFLGFSSAIDRRYLLILYDLFHKWLINIFISGEATSGNIMIFYGHKCFIWCHNSTYFLFLLS